MEKNKKHTHSIFTQSQTTQLIAQIKESGGMLVHEVIAELTAEHKLNHDGLLNYLLPLAAEFAVAPISNFKVGAIAVTQNKEGKYTFYFGANIEFQNQALSLVLHAEQAAVNNAWLNGENTIIKIAINAAPCGYCRQFINEIDSSSEIDILLDNQLIGFSGFLPNAFGPKDLGIDQGLLSHEHNHISATSHIDNTLLTHAIKSYAPYTKNYAACMIETYDGQRFYGRYAENAAYSPSLSPLQSAMSQLTLAGYQFKDETIKQVSLIEVEGKQNQLGVTKLVLESFNFTVPLKYQLLN